MKQPDKLNTVRLKITPADKRELHALSAAAGRRYSDYAAELLARAITSTRIRSYATDKDGKKTTSRLWQGGENDK